MAWGFAGLVDGEERGGGALAAAGGGAVPEALGIGVEGGFVVRQGGDGVVEADGLAEGLLVAEDEEDVGGDEEIVVGAADGDGGPEARVFLKVGEVLEATLDGGAMAAVEEEGAEAEGGEEGVAPAAITLLGGENGADEAGVEGIVGLGELVEADERERGDGDGPGQVVDQAQGELGAGGEEFVGQTGVLAGIPESVDEAEGLHRAHPFG